MSAYSRRHGRDCGDEQVGLPGSSAAAIMRSAAGGVGGGRRRSQGLGASAAGRTPSSGLLFLESLPTGAFSTRVLFSVALTSSLLRDYDVRTSTKDQIL